MQTVETLRKSGHRVFIRHYRRYQKVLVRADTTEELYKFVDVLDQKGGRTTVEITTPEGKVLHGETECSLKESFSRKKAVRVAIQRALNEEVRKARKQKQQLAPEPKQQQQKGN